ncbi:hypothetical protein [Pararhodobacter zhoushanensis]|uniref:Uncharacterized protein n=1 Tax=Pararhodobacter zhoushanensis TaxID=2479545 RepID=A0ABT3GWZ0_9RHOB|nr:hypothetical protein [Pararhodobacter zhoushanensis]MCW1932023.1 hypothetical protein [Pararhodobacter zhoushanensis]
MTLHGPFPIPPVLGTIADVMSEIRHMLLVYEAAMTGDTRTLQNKRAVQDFDLAIQSLHDLETITRKLALELPDDLVSRSAVSLGRLQLESSRSRVVAAAQGTVGARPQRQKPTIDLFAPPPDEATVGDIDTGSNAETS